MKLTPGPGIIVCRHLSLADGPMLAARLPRGCLFAVSPRFASNQPWRFLLNSYGRAVGQRMLPLSPEQPMGLKSLFRQLKNGGKVVIYPEGDISPDGELLPIQPGTAALWIRSQVPLIPIRYSLKPYPRMRAGMPINAPDRRTRAVEIRERELNTRPEQSAPIDRPGVLSIR